jgi:MYXO-CTERM domain-containing protein
VAVAAACASANAGLSFSFADPVPGRQLTNVQANQSGPGTGVMSYDQFAALTFLIDGSDEANPFTAIFSNARMEMNMSIGQGATVGGIFSAPVTGFFRIWDANTGQDILRGDATGGAFLRYANASSLQLSSDTGFAYSFGAALNSTLAANGNAGSAPINPQDGVFTITDALASGGGSIIGAGGVVKSFSANTSFSGTVATAVPAPGAMALVGLAGLLARRRRTA